MSKIKDMFYQGMNVSDKAQHKIDALVYVISKNEELTNDESFEKVINSSVYKKIIDVETFYWTIPSASIINEYLSERNSKR